MTHSAISIARRLPASRLAASFLVSAALLGGGMGLANAQDAKVPGIADIKVAKAGSYKADPAHSLIGFRVSHFGFNDYFGIFGDVKGTLQFDPADLSKAKVDVIIPLVDATTASKELTDHLKTPDFFDVAKFPEAKFVSRSVKADGTTYVIDGDLTLKGQTHPVSLKARFGGAGANPMSKAETIGFHAQTTIKRSTWGINYVVPMVSDDVALDISVAFEKQ